MPDKKPSKKEDESPKEKPAPKKKEDSEYGSTSPASERNRPK
jgi:hypothetical protein